MRAQSPDDLRPKTDEDLTEVALAWRGAQIAEVFAGRLPSTKELRDLNQELGVEVATSAFLQAAAKATGHGELSREVRSFELDAVTRELRSTANRHELLFIHSQLPQCGRKWGDHVETWRGWARAMGFTTDDVPTDPRATVSANARAILDYLKKNPHPNRIVVTYGQGASELRLLLQRSWGERGTGTESEFSIKRRELAGLRGWISVCGSFGGAAASGLATAKPWTWWASALRLRVAGRHPLVLKETSPSFSMWRTPPKFPEGFVAVSVVGVPYLSQVPLSLRASYEAIAKALPNDGVVAVNEALVPGGLVLPIQGMSHRAEDVKLEPVFKRLLGTLALKLEPMLEPRLSIAEA